MADNIVSGLFGLSPDDVRRRQYAQMQSNALAMSQMPPAQQADYYGGMAGGQIGGMLQGAMGIPNKEVEEAERRKAALQGADVQTPDGLRALAAKFQNVGMQQQAMIAAAKANEMDKLAQNELLERQKQSLAERKQTFQEQDAFDLKKIQIEAAIRQKDDQLENQRLSAQDRNEILRQSNELKRMLVEQKLSAPKSISYIDARSIEKSMQTSSGANSAMQLLDQADALYGQYTSGRDEPILGGAARWGAAVGLGNEKRVSDYETANQIAKDLGVIKLGLIGGSDTERELQVAIDTSPSPDKLPSTNRTIIANQRRAIEVLQAEPDFKTEWVNKYGSLSKLNENGEPFGKVWRKFQKENFKSVVIPSTSKVQQQSPASGGGEMSALPSPAQLTGKVVRDTVTGNRYKSDGTKWVKQ